MNSYKEMITIFKQAKVGDIFLSQGKSLISKVICKILRTQYSHTFVKISDTVLIEASDFGVRKIRASRAFKGCNFICDMGFPWEDKLRKLFCSNLVFELGKPYDYGILFGGIISRIWHRSRKLPGLFNDARSYTCSELVSTALQRCGVQLPFPPSQMTPEDLYYFIDNTEKSAKGAQL